MVDVYLDNFLLKTDLLPLNMVNGKILPLIYIYIFFNYVLKTTVVNNIYVMN